MSLRALLLLAATPVFAQFSQFAATDDGQQVYFTSPLVFEGSPLSQNFESRVYRIGPDGVYLVAQRPPATPGFSGSGSSDGVTDPQISGDGSIVGATFRNTCPPSMAARCPFPVPAEAEIIRTPVIDLGPGVLQLSRNGRWWLIAAQNATAVATLIDKSTNFATQILNPIPGLIRAVTSDGSVLVQNGIWKQGQVTPLPAIAGHSYTPVALSDNAAAIAAYAFLPGVVNSIQLILIDLSSGTPTTLFQSTGTSAPVFMGMSNDGRRALYRVTPLASFSGPAYVADAGTGQSTAIVLPPGEAAVDGTLSGDGSVAFLATTLGRIVKVTVATGAVEPLIPPTPFISNLNQLAIGSLVHLQTTYPGTIADWTGQILLGNQPLEVLGVKPGEVDVQVPWEQAAGVFPFHLGLASASPFQQYQSTFVSPIAPAFEPLDPGESAIFPIKIVKGDWSGLQTTQPRAGDIVYIYMTGLGPVSGPVQTGVPASFTTLNPLQAPLACTFSPQTAPAQTLFAGLAPGLIGVYQTAFRMPADPNAKPLNGMNCTLGTQASFGFGIIVNPFVP